MMICNCFVKNQNVCDQHDHIDFYLRDSQRKIEIRSEITNELLIDTDLSGASVKWALEIVYDYFLFSYQRLSFDNLSSPVRAFVYAYITNNAQFFEDKLFFSDGDKVDYNPMVSLDIVAHEFAHGVNEHSAGFNGSGESGALDESFSDIFAAAIEHYYNPNDYSNIWIQGDKPALSLASEFRYLYFPNSSNPPHPDTYFGTYWDINNDRYINSGVGNYWFYLLSNGGESTNDNSDDYCVEGIGIEKAALIAYNTLTTYLGMNSNYSDVRYYSIQVAKLLYGNTSNEVIQVTNAWYAVGVGSEYSEPITVQNRTAYENENIINRGTITASNFTIPPAYSCTFQSGYDSGPAIFLKDGFHAQNGSNFHAFVAPVECQSNAGRKAKPTHDNPSISGDTKLENNESEKQSLENKSILKNTITQNAYALNPNPFSSKAFIEYNLPAKSNVSITIQNIYGKEVVRILNNLPQEAGSHKIVYDASSLPPGIYICTFEAKNEKGFAGKETKKLVKLE